MPTNHALLSPSSASRWLACTPSARLEEKLPDRQSEVAAEGTFAHELSELMLRNHFGFVKQVIYKQELKRLKANSFYSAELLDHCNTYVTNVIETYNAMNEGARVIVIEEKINITEYVPDGFGTVDALIISDGILHVNDLKYGKGVKVEAHENKQMMLYALGALDNYMFAYDIHTVRMTIHQPRLDHFPTFEMSAADLISWGNNHVRPRAEQAYEGAGELVAGDHCRFCKVRNTCKALADMNLELAKYAFEDPNKLTDKDIADILSKAATFKTWISSIEEYALTEAVKNQKKWPGFKLVAGRSTRAYSNKDEIVKILKKNKFDKTLFLSEPTLVGITALEKNIGKDQVEKLVGKFIVKPEGAPTLVPEWDKRPELKGLDSAREAFENVEV